MSQANRLCHRLALETPGEGVIATTATAAPTSKFGVALQDSMVKVPTTLAAPQLGSCASSGRAWRLWATRHAQGEAQAHRRSATASGAQASRLQRGGR